MSAAEEDELEVGLVPRASRAFWGGVQILDALVVWIAVAICAVLFCVVAIRNGPPSTASEPEVIVPPPKVNRASLLFQQGGAFFDAGDYPTAISCYSDLIESRSSHANVLPALLNRAVAQARLARLGKALDDLQQATNMIQSYPELRNWGYDIALKTAQVRCLNNEYDSAIDILNRVAETGGTTLDLLTLRCLALWRKNDVYGSARDLSRILHRSPSKLAYMNRAVAFHTLQKYSLALADMSRAATYVSQAKNNLSSSFRQVAALNHCRVLKDAGMYGEAVAETTGFINEGIAVSEMHSIRAESLRRLGKVEGAVIDERLAKPRSDDVSTQVVARDLKNGSEENSDCQFFAGGVFEIILEVVGELPKSRESAKIESSGDLIAAAMERVTLADPGDAVAMLEKHLSVFPKDAQARIRRVAVLLDIGDLDEAMRDLEILAISEGGNQTVRSLRGLAFARKGEPEKAIAEFSYAIRLNDSQPVGYFNRGTVYVSQEEWALAAADFSRANARGDDSPTTLNWLARALAKSGKYTEALFYHDRLVSELPSALAFKFRALTHAEFGNTALALSDFENSLALNASDSEVLALRTKLLLQNKQYKAALDGAKSLVSIQREDATAVNLVRRLEEHLVNSTNQNSDN